MLSIGELIDLIQEKHNMTEKAFLSFLPVAHSFERVGGHYGCFNAGMQIYYAENLPDMSFVVPNIQEVRPTFLTAVPRILKRFMQKLWKALNQLPE